MRPKHGILTLVACAALVVPASGQSVSQDWVDRYDGSGQGIDGTDRGFAIAVDSLGHTIVGGFSAEAAGGTYLAIKYAPDGTRTWVATETTTGGGGGRTMTLDDQDNVIVAGSSNNGERFGVVKYDSDGNLLWSRRFNPGPGFLTQFDGVGTDSSGAVYAFGNHWPSTNDPWSIVVVKWDAAGTRQWSLVHATPSSQASAMRVTDDAVYLVGNAEVAQSDQDFLVMKVLPEGTIDWVRTCGRSGQFVHDTAWDLDLDAAGNVVATGSYSGIFADPNTSTDIAVVRVAPDGTLVSEIIVDGPFGSYDEGRRVALDAFGNVVVGGRSEHPDGGSDVLAVKLDPAGNELWRETWGGLATFTDLPHDMVLDDLGAIYLTGETISPGLVRECVTIKFDASGALRWSQTYGGATHDPSYGLGVAVTPDRRVMVTGYSAGLGPFGDSDLITLRYDQTLAGDVDADGDVDLSDLAALLADFGCTAIPCSGDADGDGDTDLSDLAVLLGNFGA